MGQRETVLDISGLHSSYGMIKAIKDINIHVDKGELVSLLGANGAGKSTLLKSIIGMVHIESGSVKYQGEELVGRKSHEIIPMGISIVPEGRKIFADATVMENLAIGSYTRAADKALDQKILDQVFEFFPRLAERKGQMGGTLSGGEQQMLAFSSGMMGLPKLLIMDEPSLGLAPNIVDNIFSIAKEVAQESGLTIILVEQDVRKALRIANRGYVIENGQITVSGTAEELLNNDEVKKAYLGF